MRAVLALACACSGVPHSPRTNDVERSPITAELAAPLAVTVEHPASVYDEALPPVPPDALHAAVAAGLAQLASGKGDPQPDARLDRVAEVLAGLAARGGELERHAAVVDFVLHAHGIVEPAAAIAVSRASGADAIVAEVGPQIATSLYFGNVHVGVGGSSPVVVIVTHTSMITLPPTLPRAIEARGSIPIDATLNPAFHAPHVTITHDDRTTERPPVTATDRWSFRTQFACGDHTGEQWVLFEACDERNVVQRLALVPIECGTKPATTYYVEPRANTAGDPQRQLAAIVSRIRAADGLAPLRGDLRVDATARAMADAMRASGRIDHALGGTTQQRLLDAGLIPPHAYEATLHAPDVATAAELLMNEPGYRELLDRDDVTHGAVAIAIDAHGELYVAIELVAIVPPIDTQRLHDQIIARLTARLPKNETLRLDPVLDRLANKYVAGRAAGWSETTMMDVIQHDPDLAFGPFGTLKRAMTLLLADDIDKVDLGPDHNPDGVAVAIAQAPRYGPLVGRTWVIVLYARRR